MEGVGGRLGRSSSRYGPTTVFTGPVRKWKKNWVHVTNTNTAATPNNNNNNNNNNNKVSIINSSNGNCSSNDNGSYLKLYKWTPIRKSQSHSNGDVKDDGGEEENEPPRRRKIKYIPIALLEEQKKDSPEEPLDKSVETYPTDEKPDINDVPMEENEVSEDANAGRQVLNESKLDLNAHDADEDGEETEDQER